MFAAMNFKSLQELRFLGPGFNWMKIQGMIAVAVGGYDSPLPPGTKVLVETFDPGKACMEFACPMFKLEGVVEHDGKGTLIPRSEGAKLEKRTLDGPVYFETRYK